jgi:hypothetical protein
MMQAMGLQMEGHHSKDNMFFPVPPDSPKPTHVVSEQTTAIEMRTIPF